MDDQGIPSNTEEDKKIQPMEVDSSIGATEETQGNEATATVSDAVAASGNEDTADGNGADGAEKASATDVAGGVELKSEETADNAPEQ